MSVVRFMPIILDAAPATTSDQRRNRKCSLALRRGPAGQPHKGGCPRLPAWEDVLEAREDYLHLLPLATLPGAFGYQQDSGLGQGSLQRLASVDQVPKDPAQSSSPPAPETRPSEQFLGQPDLRDVAGSELVGERHQV